MKMTKKQLDVFYTELTKKMRLDGVRVYDPLADLSPIEENVVYEIGSLLFLSADELNFLAGEIVLESKIKDILVEGGAL